MLKYRKSSFLKVSQLLLSLIVASFGICIDVLRTLVFGFDEGAIQQFCKGRYKQIVNMLFYFPERAGNYFLR